MTARTKSRDASQRLYFSDSSLPMYQFPAICGEIVVAFQLVPRGELVTDKRWVIFQAYYRGPHSVELAWDDFMGFAVTALTPESETLAEEIAHWFIANHS